MPPAPTLISETPAAGPPAELANLPTEKLKALLAKSLERTARELARLAWIVRILEERGEDLSGLGIGLIGYLRRIAYGQVLPEAVVRFAESPALMRRVAALPAPDQRRLAEGAPVALVVRDAAGGHTHRLVDPLKMTPSQVAQAFGPNGLRDEAEQINRLGEREAGGTPRAKRPRGKVAADPTRGGIRVGRAFVPTAAIVEALAELAAAAPEDDATPDSPVVFKVTDGEHYSLRRAALDGGTDVNKLVRRALRAHGLLSGPRPEGSP